MPLLWISLAFIIGAVISLFILIQWPLPAAAMIFFGVASVFERLIFNRFYVYTRLRQQLITPLMLLGMAFCAGLLRGEAGKPYFHPTDLAYYNGKEAVILRAMASQPVENHDNSTLLTVTGKEISTDGINYYPVKGEAVILLPAGRMYTYGDTLEITGNLETPPERADFSYKQYLENRGVFSYLSYPKIYLIEKNGGNPILTAIYSLRDRIASTCERIVPQPEAAFLSGVLVGRDEKIPETLKRAFQNTGTSHLVAISGFNITILSALILMFTSRLLPRGWSEAAAILLLAGYAVMAGASPSVIRAAIMGSLAMIGRSIGRTRAVINTLGLAAGIMVAQNPLILRDIGFQLSVAATAGILLIGAPLNDRFLARMTAPEKPAEVNWLWQNLGDFVLITLAAQAATLPFLLYHFHQYPLIGMLVNPFVLPVQPAAMILGGAAALGGMIYLPLGQLLGFLAWIPLAFTTRVVEFFSPYHHTGQINLHLDFWLAAAAVVLLIATVAIGRRWMNWWRNLLLPASFVVSFSVLALLINGIFHHPDGKMHVRVFRQGKDLSALIHSPGGQRILVSNRPGDKDLRAFVDRQMPALDKNLAVLFIPNPTTSTTVNLADSLTHFRPDWLLVNPNPGGYRTQSRLKETSEDVNLELLPPEQSMRFDLGYGAILSFAIVSEDGSGITIAWGANRIDLYYGVSSDTGTSGSTGSNAPNVIIQDHPEKANRSGQIGLFLSAEDGLNDRSTSLLVPDGGWLDVVSDGRMIQILENTNGSR